MGLFNPLVSIVIPVYNGANYVAEAIESALKQSYKNIEIIVVNDGSTDNTEKIVKKYGDKIRYFYKENGGVASALNLGIKNMKGEYFSWLSHDDIYYTNKIEIQIEALRTLIDRETIIYSNYKTINKNGQILHSVIMDKYHEKRKLNNGLYAVLNGCLNGCTLLIPKTIFTRVGYFDESKKYTQDYYLWNNFFSIGINLLHISKSLVKTRIHEKQGSRDINNANIECDSLWIYLLSSLSDNQYKEIFGSEVRLLKNILPNIKNLKYTKATEYIENRLNKLNYGSNLEPFPKITCIITCYNQGKTIDRAILSVLNQNYKNIEIIVVDDCSDDLYTINKLNAYNSPNVKIIYLTKNKGVSFARNTGLKYATGDFIQFLDGDDYLLENKFHIQINEFKKNNNIDISYSNFYYFKEDKIKIIKPNIDSLKLSTNKEFEDLLKYWQTKILIPIHTYMIKSKCFDFVRFNEELNICEDYLVFLELAYRNYEFKFIDKELCVYCIQKKNNSIKNYFNVTYYLTKCILMIENNFIEPTYNYINDIEYFNIRLKKYLYISIKSGLPQLCRKEFIILGIIVEEKKITLYLFGIKITFKKKLKSGDN